MAPQTVDKAPLLRGFAMNGKWWIFATEEARQKIQFPSIEAYNTLCRRLFPCRASCFGGRIFHQCKANLRAAAQPHYAFPKKRLGTYVEEGKSGKSIEGRTEFRRMLDDIQSGKVHTDYVLVFKLS